MTRDRGGGARMRPVARTEDLVPTYDYQCDQCGQTFEVQQRISAPPLTSCQFCQGPVRRLIAPAAFILKGRGWYVTDYPSEARKKGLEAEKKAEPVTSSSGSDGQSGSTAQSESKPESKTPPKSESKPAASAPSKASSTTD